MNPRRVASASLLFVSIVACSSATALPAGTTIYDRQLVYNGAAELDPGTADPKKAQPATGWHRVANFAPVLVLRYGAKGGFPRPDSPGASDGHNFFWGGYTARASASQDIDLSQASADIDAHIVHFKLSAWLGGRENTADHSTVSVTCLDRDGQTLGSAYVGPVTNADRGGVTSFQYRETSRVIPAGARTARISILMVRYEGDSNDGYLDGISYVLHKSAMPAR